MADLWIRISQEREALRDLLPTLTEGQWKAPSLCEGWSVHDVVAHMISAYEREILPTAIGLLRSGFSLDRHNERTMQRIGAVSNKTLVARYNATVDLRSRLPIPTQFVLAESLVHNEDIFMALDRERVVPIEAVLIVAHLYRSIGVARRWKKTNPYMKLVASNADWSYGDGDVARGPLLAIVMVLTGRTVASRFLEGPGAARLQRERSAV